MTDASTWTPEEEALVARLGRAIVERRMAMPALLFLEGIRPLRSIGSNILYFFSPLVGIVLPRVDLERAAAFFEKPGAVGALVDEIERLEEERRKSEREAKDLRRRDRNADRAPSEAQDRTDSSA